MYCSVIKRRLESRLPTIWTCDRWKSTARKKLRHVEMQKEEDERWRRSGREMLRREKMQVCEKGRKVAKH